MKEIQTLSQKARWQMQSFISYGQWITERFVEKLVRYPYYRLRVGDYRVILDIKHESVRILILNAGHRVCISFIHFIPP